jgi:isoleucyl-tRNA synthetase
MSTDPAPQKKPQSVYKTTIRLPQTDFPMKADLHLREPEQIKRWNDEQIYQAILKKNAAHPEFRLHDGPPYANGTIHHGHMLNKILKDITVKYRSMTGWKVEYIPGWDTHGLPIEHQVDKELGEKKHTLTTIEKRAACEKYARKWIDVQREGFVRLGVFGQWEKPYLTLNKDYEAAITRTLAKFVDKGSLVRGHKPVHWSWAAETALAEAEVEYDNVTSPSIYVKYPVHEGLPAALAEFAKGLSAYTLIWTTTPWTLPASLAVSVLPEADYVLAKIKNRKGVTEAVLVAAALAEGVAKAAGAELLALSPAVKGADLAGLVSEHPFIPFAERKIPTLLGQHVTLESGSGLVHTAPGHGPDDFVIGSKYGLPPFAPVDGKGIFTKEAGKYAGGHIFKTNPIIVADLDAADRLLSSPEDKLTHSYPHCWRTHTPAIFRATPQWFISMENNDLRKKALAEIDRVKWIPSWGRDRIYNMIAGRPDWCISRQRVWGVPIPVVYCKACETPLLSGDFMRHIAGIFEKEGGDAWWARSVQDLVPAGTKCSKCSGAEFQKETDILDVWFESGVSFNGVYEKAADRPGLRKTDLYLEGSDQHRGWFHSSLLCSVGTEGRAPYEAVLTHGFVVDGQGKKISKSKGNYVDPAEVIAKSGAETIRLWVASEDYREDIRISNEIVTRLSDAYRKFRNTLRFLLGNLGDFDPKAHAARTGDDASPKDLDVLDRYAMHLSETLSRRLRKAYESYEYHQVFHTLNEFISVDLSAFYLDVLKDRLYVDAADSPLRRSAQAALWNITHDLVRLVAPVFAFTAEEAYRFLPKKDGMPTSVHLTDMPKDRPAWLDEKLAADFAAIGSVREVAMKALEEERQKKVIGSGLEARVVVQSNEPVLKRYEKDLAAYFIVSEVALAAGDLKVTVEKAHGTKCERCWTYRTDVGNSTAHPTLCARCDAVVKKV